MANTRGRQVYDHRAWRIIRRQILQRDNQLCQIHGPRCTTHATEVDHIVPIAAGGARFDPANLRAACRQCNAGRSSRTHHQDGWRTATTHLTLITGPPGAGKTTWVEQHRQPGDLVIDFDKIAEAIGSTSGHDHNPGVTSAARMARAAILRGLKRGDVQAERAWIISANPDAEQFIPHHDAVTIDPGRDETHRRARAAGRPPTWATLIDDWYNQRSDAPTRATPPPSRTW